MHAHALAFDALRVCTVVVSELFGMPVEERELYAETISI